MCIGQFSFLQFLGSFIFGHFWPFFDTFGIFGTLVEIWGILWVLVSYEVTRWIILVIARVHDGFGGGVGGFKRGFGGVWGGLGGSHGCLLYPYKAFFAHLEVLYGTRFCSKHHIMVQLANIYKVGITDPFLGLLEHYQRPPKGNFIAKQAILRPQLVPNLAFCPLKWSSAGP